MGYRIVNRFFDRTSGRYFDPGQDCPLLPEEDAARLVRARCLVEVQVSATAPETPPAPPADSPAAPAPPVPPAAPRAPRRGATSPKE